MLGTRSTARVTANTNKATSTITAKLFIDRVIPISPPFSTRRYFGGTFLTSSR
jgi:hypothetical protein